MGARVAAKFAGDGDDAPEEESRAQAFSNFRLFRSQRMASAQSCQRVRGERGASLSGASSRGSVVKKGSEGAGTGLRVAHTTPVRLGSRLLVSTSRRNGLFRNLLALSEKFAMTRRHRQTRQVRAGLAWRALPELPRWHTPC